jgi:cytochrome c-type biogenesis protein CcmH/NrfF
MSDVSSGAVLTLVVPLSLLVVVIGLWALSQRRRLRGRGEPTAPRHDG